jgi:hypothetical protein
MTKKVAVTKSIQQLTIAEKADRARLQDERSKKAARKKLEKEWLADSTSQLIYHLRRLGIPETSYEITASGYTPYAKLLKREHPLRGDVMFGVSYGSIFAIYTLPDNSTFQCFVHNLIGLSELFEDWKQH